MSAKLLTANIELGRIIKIGIWNNQNTYYKLDTVYTKLTQTFPGKEVYVANCGFFSMSNPWFPVFGLKIDGKVLSNDWSQGGWIGFTKNHVGYGLKGALPSNWDNAVSGYPSLLENGQKASSFTYCIDNSNRGRTMLGYSNTELLITCVEDVTGNSDFTLDEEIQHMKNLNARFAINLDGGGSTQCNFNGQIITSARKVNNFIYVIAEPNKSKDVITVDGSWGPATSRYTQMMFGTTVDGIISGQPAANKKYLPACSTSSWRFYKTASGSMCVKKLQQLVGADVDGYCGPGTVKALQAFLLNKGYYAGAIDGYMNTSTVVAWQKYVNAYFKR